MSRFFQLNEIKLPKLKSILLKINSIQKKQCGPKEMIPNKNYPFKHNIHASIIISLVEEIGSNIVKQIVNYDLKVVALIVEHKGVIGYLPCFPSGLDSEIPYEMISESYNLDYITTYKFLKSLYLKSRGKIPCNPRIKVVQDGMIVAIVTETNQSILLKSPELNNFDDDLHTRSINLLEKEINEIIFLNKKNGDAIKNTENYVQLNKIKLETHFFDAFKRHFFFHISKNKNFILKKRLVEILNISEDTFITKFKVIKDLIIKFMKNKVEFVDNSILDEFIQGVDFIQPCYKNSNASICVLNDEDETNSKLLIPKENLHNGKDNSKYYFHYLTDSILRKKDFFEDQGYNFYKKNFTVTKNELLIRESKLTQDFFSNIMKNVNINENPYLQNIPFDNLAMETNINEKFLQTQGFTNEQFDNFIESNSVKLNRSKSSSGLPNINEDMFNSSKSKRSLSSSQQSNHSEKSSSGVKLDLLSSSDEQSKQSDRSSSGVKLDLFSSSDEQSKQSNRSSSGVKVDLFSSSDEQSKQSNRSSSGVKLDLFSSSDEQKVNNQTEVAQV